MAGVFISYRRDDSAGFAGALERELVTRLGRDRVFMDIKDIEGGTEFPTAIDQALKSSDVVIVLIGSRWLDATDAQGIRRLEKPGDFVRREVEFALAGRARVIPLLLDGTLLPAVEKLPIDLQPLRKRQTLELRNSHWDEDIARLLNHIREAMFALNIQETAEKIIGEGFNPNPPSSVQVNSLFYLGLALGVIFVVTGVVTGIESFRHQLPWYFALIFGGAGLLMCAGGALPFALRDRRRRMTKRLLKDGRPILTTFHRVEENTTIEVNGRHPFYVTTLWRNPVSHDLVQFRSPALWADPTAKASDRMITVMIDPDNLHHYVMDLSFLYHADPAIRRL
ncbi:toll/interleukin-1 receptor domain-containing protein [Alloacidobacterium dinghuense]|uniref:Toll/interleukin-1 receptor domain-containing protein n=1 Tax=Alloacidobacterium dinghuense TaxID=2763107 RepID=A0A7G8BQ57_9BACT|nr:toll/interleukin-1 receptor domain-containing protein [Alloacidobacterium dinghuense]QNI34677.1 toll/interleukin-1 receptor domain-containing protein [Alloacidobacterium dinghuense]